MPKPKTTNSKRRATGRRLTAAASAPGTTTIVTPSGETLPVRWSGTAIAAPAERAGIDALFDSIHAPEMTQALELAAIDDKRMKAFNDLQIDSGYANYSIAARMRLAGIQPRDIVQAIVDLHNADADLRVARRLPVIMEHMAAEAAPRIVPCSQCQTEVGKAKRVIKKLKRKTSASAAASDDDDVCRQCGGVGTVTLEADNDVRKMLLESAGRLGNRGPLIDARQMHVHRGGGQPDSGVPDLTEFARSTDEAYEERGSFRQRRVADEKREREAQEQETAVEVEQEAEVISE